MRQSSDAGLDKGADVIVRHQARKLIVVLDEVWAGSDDAHVAAEHVPKLRDFVDAEFAEPFSERVNPFVAIAGLPLQLLVIGTHGAKFVNFELSILHTGADLRVKKRARRLEPLRDPNDGHEERENEKRHWNCDGEIDGPFEKTVQRALQRFFAETNEAEAVVFEVRHGMPQLFLQIADNDEPDAELIANANDIAVDLGEERELQQNDLGDAELPNYLLEFFAGAENRDSVFGLVDLLIADQTDGAQPDLGLTTEPLSQLGRFAAGTHQQSFFIPSAGEDSACQKRRQIVV